MPPCQGDFSFTDNNQLWQKQCCLFCAECMFVLKLMDLWFQNPITLMSWHIKKLINHWNKQSFHCNGLHLHKPVFCSLTQCSYFMELCVLQTKNGKGTIWKLEGKNKKQCLAGGWKVGFYYLMSFFSLWGTGILPVTLIQSCERFQRYFLCHS